MLRLYAAKQLYVKYKWGTYFQRIPKKILEGSLFLMLLYKYIFVNSFCKTI